MAAWLGWGPRWSRTSSGAAAEAVSPDAVGSLRAEPITFAPDTSGGFALPEEDLARVLRKVDPMPEGMSASLCLHAMAAHGLDAKFQGGRFRSSQDLLRVFTDDAFAKASLGAPVIVGTRHGLRPAMYANFGASKESHYDQTLGCMAQLRLPLTLPIRVDGKSWTLRDVLRDSIACFEPRQAEIEWTAIAYASYLPPHREWVNKFGERYSFDRLTDELLARDPLRASCCGCHIVDALILLLRVDREVTGLLSPEVRGRAVGRLRELVRSALSLQADDGSWGADWYRGVPSVASAAQNPWPENRSDTSRLLATSHIAHWMMDLPSDLRVSHDVLRRAEVWLYGKLKETTPEFVRQNYCPCSHGAWVLRVASRGAARPLRREDTPRPAGASGPRAGGGLTGSSITDGTRQGPTKTLLALGP